MRTRNFLALCVFCVVLAAVIVIAIVISFYIFMPGPATASPIPAKFEIYFLALGDNGQLVAYGPNYSVNVVVKMDVSTVSPHIEVKKMKNRQEEFVAWGHGGTLQVKDRKQLEELLLR